MAEIIKFRDARKRLARAEKERKAAENRTRFGRTKAERTATEAESARSTRELDGKRREDGGDGEDGASS